MEYYEVRNDDKVQQLMECFRSSIYRGMNEEQLRFAVCRCFDKCLSEARKELGIDDICRDLEVSVSGKRIDALYNNIVVEFKAPGKLDTVSGRRKAIRQIENYIEKLAGKHDKHLYVGIIISDKIIFVRYSKVRNKWIIRGAYDLLNSAYAVKMLIETLRNAGKKALTEENLYNDLGRELAVETVCILYRKLEQAVKTNTRVKLLYEDWKKVFSRTGYNIETLRKEKEHVSGVLGKIIGNIERDKGKELTTEDYDKIMFSLHTYYALITKLLAVEILSRLAGGIIYRSYIGRLIDLYNHGKIEKVKQELERLEDGRGFMQYNISNFIEGDYFSWYVDVLDRELMEKLYEILEKIDDYNMVTSFLAPEYARDLMKGFYQRMVPKKIRHDMGEYYTPDWLAELVLERVCEYIGEKTEDGECIIGLDKKVIDPACGTGTFLVLILEKMREYAEQSGSLEKFLDVVKERRVMGFDINPLSVMASRLSYLLKIADLIGVYGSGDKIEIPVYLADSIVVRKRFDVTDGLKYEFRTVLGKPDGVFVVVHHVVRSGVLSRLLSIIKEKIIIYDRKCDDDKVLSEYRDDIEQKLIPEIAKRMRLMERDKEVIVDNAIALYEQFCRLHKQGKDKIWTSILQNVFMPAIIGEWKDKNKFDLVVGNPPWVNWENIDPEYRNDLKELFDEYKIGRSIGAGMGKVKRDLASLFLVRSADMYLKKGGIIAFLVPFTLFKNMASAGFRAVFGRSRLRTGSEIKLEALEVHDLSDLEPFEDAKNLPGLIIARKPYDKSEVDKVYFVKHYIWRRRGIINYNDRLDDVRDKLVGIELDMIPISSNDMAYPWIQIFRNMKDVLRKTLVNWRGQNTSYTAHEGVNTGLNSVYYVKVLEEKNGLVHIENIQKGAKRRVSVVDARVEKELVYPLLRGKNIKRWVVNWGREYIILPVDPNTGKIYSEIIMKKRYPKAYDYFERFKEELRQRKGEPYRSLMKNKGVPAYYVFNTREYLFSRYKVVWSRIGSGGGSAVGFGCSAVIGRYIPDDSTIMVAVNSEDEAYYLSGVLNSIIVRALVAGYTYGIRQETNILKFIYVPRYDPNNGVHREIAEISKKIHEYARRGKTTDMYMMERQLDMKVAELYGITQEELRQINKLYKILAGK